MKNIQKHIVYGLIIVLVISTINVFFYFLNHDALPGIRLSLEYFGWSVYFTVGLYSVNAWVSNKVQKNFPKFDLGNIVKKFIIGTVGSAIVSLVTGSLLYLIMRLFYGDPWSEALHKLFFSADSSEGVRLMVWFAVTIAVIFQTASLIQYYQSGQLKEQKKQVIRISKQHESLKSQISSHFLFNSLNVLTGLIEENSEKAQEFVGDLSSVYRYVLEQKDKEWVPLEEEIEFCRTYMELVQKRYEDGLLFEIDSDLPNDYLIAPLTLQILIENCIKHNRVSSDEPLYIKVYKEADYLIVRNNFQLKKQLNQSTGKGLEHIQSQYQNFENRVKIIQDENNFTVKIPFITKNNIIMEINKKYTEEEYRAAKERVEQIQGFYWNLVSYLVVNSFFTFLDIKNDGVYNWAYWPLIGWGIGVTFHAINVFGIFNSAGWKNRMIQKELEKRKEERDYFDSQL
ncbi:MAG: histidine kinase [Moheibacter sp.]